jgi:hypothetical protein
VVNGSIHVEGTVRLKIEFLDSGNIGKIFPISELPYGLTASAIEAAKKIKFNPEIKNGTPITVSKTIENAFSDGSGWRDDSPKDEKAETILKRAVEKLGGQKYLQAKSIASTGNFTPLSGGQAQMPTSFVDVIVFPDRERTEFKQGGIKTVQTNAGSTGWIFDGAAEIIKTQTPSQIEDFRRGIRASLDNILRGYWRSPEENAALTYVGRRQAGVGRRNDVVKLTYKDGFAVEFEFTDEGLPAKSLYARQNDGGEDLKEEDRYAQFVESQGIYAPFIIDHYINGKHTSRINYTTVQFNRSFPDSIFAKPASLKDAKKEVKF